MLWGEGVEMGPVNPVRVRFLGSGDAFGSGGRLPTCIHIESGGVQFLLDCGPSCLPAMRLSNIDPNQVEMVVLTHLHGDHFGGLPFLILDAKLISRRTVPLTVVGPSGTEQRVYQAMEVLFPGSSGADRRFTLHFAELEPGRPFEQHGVRVTSFLADHASGAPALAVRVECGGKVIAYTGDTQWTDNLIPAGRGADLLIAECYFHHKKVKYHLDYETLMEHSGELGAKRLVLTHMSQDMLGALDEVDCEWACDGREFEV